MTWGHVCRDHNRITAAFPSFSSRFEGESGQLCRIFKFLCICRASEDNGGTNKGNFPFPCRIAGFRWYNQHVTRCVWDTKVFLCNGPSTDLYTNSPFFYYGLCNTLILRVTFRLSPRALRDSFTSTKDDRYSIYSSNTRLPPTRFSMGKDRHIVISP